MQVTSLQGALHTKPGDTACLRDCCSEDKRWVGKAYGAPLLLGTLHPFFFFFK